LTAALIKVRPHFCRMLKSAAQKHANIKYKGQWILVKWQIRIVDTNFCRQINDSMYHMSYRKEAQTQVIQQIFISVHPYPCYMYFAPDVFISMQHVMKN
jgi:hypothetical protein